MEPNTLEALSSRIVHLDEVIPVPWKNGGGQTRELLAWPDGEAWQLRLSVAEIGRDGPFSSFSGITRWFAVIAGEGVVLRFGSEERRLLAGGDPLRFDGSWAPGCRLIDGPTRDLNLMITSGLGAMIAARPGKPWTADFAQRGLFATVAGRLVPEHDEPVDISADTLFWQGAATSGAWRFEPAPWVPDSAVGAWWLGYTPEHGSAQK